MCTFQDDVELNRIISTVITSSNSRIVNISCVYLGFIFMLNIFKLSLSAFIVIFFLKCFIQQKMNPY